MNWKEIALLFILFVLGSAIGILIKGQRRGNGYNGKNRRKY